MWYSETIGTIKTPRALTVDGIQHPANIFTAWSKQELAAIGFYPARVKSVDSRYYDTGSETYELVDGEYVISYATTEKDVELLKEDLIKKVQANTGALLAPSDWRVIRSIDSENAMSSEWTTYRNEVRAHGNSLESGIEAFASVDAVRNFQNHAVQEELRIEVTDDEGVTTVSDETETINRTVDKTYWGWPESPDAEDDPLHVRYL
jgi:hypothetical protein